MANDTSPTSPTGAEGPAPASSLPPLPDPSTVGQIPPRQKASFSDAIKSINWDSLSNIHKTPCARQTFLTGIATGFAFGGVKLVLRAPLYSACNWAVGMFTATSWVVWEACEWRRGREQDGMIRAMQIIEYKKLEREKKLEERREQLRVQKEEEERLKREAEKRWWKPW
ncbi:hypothetical protein TWF718_001615 [Orbilia javanica]|uniref:Cytochrome c oxidase assembly protein COX20, mitochondrial n=1 Tax=Orbilia javanica TaxID=47235 RepID=A0AAN8RNI2_9PEZI